MFCTCNNPCSLVRLDDVKPKKLFIHKYFIHLSRTFIDAKKSVFLIVVDGKIEQKKFWIIFYWSFFRSDTCDSIMYIDIDIDNNYYH